MNYGLDIWRKEDFTVTDIDDVIVVKFMGKIGEHYLTLRGDDDWCKVEINRQDFDINISIIEGHRQIDVYLVDSNGKTETSDYVTIDKRPWL